MVQVELKGFPMPLPLRRQATDVCFKVLVVKGDTVRR
jgi:hypothetical protein